MLSYAEVNNGLRYPRVASDDNFKLYELFINKLFIKILILFILNYNKSIILGRKNYFKKKKLVTINFF